jgi:hypothetical protein
VTQACVVTLEPVVAHLEQDFTASFAPGGAADAGEIVVALDDARSPDEIVDGRIDLRRGGRSSCGALDPYPRSPAAAEAAAGGGTEMTGAREPFAALESWQGNAKKPSA